jgi:endoglucanase
VFKVKNASLCAAAGLLLLIALNCVAAEDSKEAVGEKTIKWKGERAMNAEGANKAVLKKLSPDPFELNKRLGRGVNLGNALDAPSEGEWGVTLEEGYFQAIKDAGFDSVRLPVRWSNHALKDRPYTIDPNFFNRVDWAINCALSRNLPVILNVHHYLEIYSNPSGHKERYLAFWKQIAPRYKDYPDNLLFELMNEPKNKLTAKLWNEYMKEALAIVRQSNPRRTIVIGPADNNIIPYLKFLDIPKDDRNIIVSIHYYFPLEFTHQGAAWITRGDPNDWLGIKWPYYDTEKKTVVNDFNFAAEWAKENNRPMNLGEFGAYEKADMESRARWTKFVADTAVERGMSFHYWQFASDFAVYDTKNKTWIKPLFDALLPPRK